MADFAQTLMTALAVGSLYALIALGYTMVYGILKFINFAHSDIVVLGRVDQLHAGDMDCCRGSGSIRTIRRRRRRCGSAAVILVAAMARLRPDRLRDRAARLQAAAQSAAAERADHGDRRVAAAAERRASSNFVFRTSSPQTDAGADLPQFGSCLPDLSLLPSGERQPRCRRSAWST